MLNRERVSRDALPVRRIFLALVSTAVILVVLSCFVQLQGQFDPTRRNLRITLFDVSAELNIPSWFSAALWLSAGLSCMICAYVAETRRGQWILLGIFCCAFSLDETASLHERLLEEVGATMLGSDRPSFLQWAWVVPGAIIGLVVAASCLRLIWSLPRRQRLAIILAGAIFVTGALVVESITDAIHANAGPGYAFVLTNALEEGLEMLGVILMLCALLSMLRVRRSVSAVEISLLCPPVGDSPAATGEGVPTGRSVGP